MKRRIAMIAAAAVLLAGGATVATTASARDSFSISIGAPGFAVGYATPGYGYGYYAPPVVYAPPVWRLVMLAVRMLPRPVMRRVGF